MTNKEINKIEERKLEVGDVKYFRRILSDGRTEEGVARIVKICPKPYEEEMDGFIDDVLNDLKGGQRAIDGINLQDDFALRDRVDPNVIYILEE